MGIVFLINLLSLAAFPQSAQAVTIKSITVAAALKVIDIVAIPGVTVPVRGAVPVTAINETDQYTGTVSWSPTRTGTIFGPFTSYTATIILAPKPGFTLTGVAADLFTVAGAAPVNNPVNSGDVTAVFPATAQVSIGDSFGGGKVFYIDASKQHGLIAAPADISGSCRWSTEQTSTVNETDYAYQTVVTTTGIGSGQANTNAILAKWSSTVYPNTAAAMCDNYLYAGYTDWYLPSKDELQELYNQRVKVGGFADNYYYWSSSENDAYSAWGQIFYIGNQTISSKYYNYRVRAVRAF